jgi:hypothetical protein
MAEYKSVSPTANTVQRTADGAFVPQSDPEYVAWLAGGGVPDPADPPAPLVSDEIEIKPPPVRTVGNQTAEIFRATIPTRSAYAGSLTLMGIDAANGSSRRVTVEISVGRWDGGAVQFTGSPTIGVNHPAGANPPPTPVASWSVVQGNDYVLSVSGTGGRTFDWQLIGTARRFKPQGL